MFVKRLLIFLALLACNFVLIGSHLAQAQPYNYNANPSPILQDLKALGVPRFDSVNGALLTPQGASISLTAIAPSTVTAGTVTTSVLNGPAAIAGTATNNSAASGVVGEAFRVCVASGSAVSLTTATAANVGTVTFTVGGDYDVEANANFTGTGATVTAGSAGISLTSATLPTDGSELYDGSVTTTQTYKSSIALPPKRVSLAAGAPVFLVVSKTFSAGAVSAFGCITARRVR